MPRIPRFAASTRLQGGQMQPHEARDGAEGFGADAERYDRAPELPQAMVDRIVALGDRFTMPYACVVTAAV